MNIAICILTLNEIECLTIIIPRLLKYCEKFGEHSIFAVDGGSNDGTVLFLKSQNILVLEQKKRGRGEAIKTAIEATAADAIIFFSPDGNENENDLNKFRIYLEAGADLVIASRMMFGAKNEEDIYFFRPRKTVNKVFNFTANKLFNKNIFVSDSINGFRGIKINKARKLNLVASDYTIEYEMSIKSMKNGYNIVEFPTIEGQRISGKTKVPSLPAGLQFIKRLFLEIFDELKKRS